MVLHLFGDSLFRGYALGRFPDIFTAAEAAAEPLWELRSPASMLNLVFEGNGAEIMRAADGTVTGGRMVAGYVGCAVQPDPKVASSASEKIRSGIAAGVIRAGDVIALIDAGDHRGDPDEYEENWGRLRAAADQAQVTVAMFDMFDYITKAEIGGKPADTYRYDVPFRGHSGKLRSHNEATRASASKSLGGQSDCRLIPLRAIMDRFQAVLARDYGVPAMLPDGIHPNIWGQWLLALALAGAVADISRFTAPESVLGLVKRHWARMSYVSVSPDWSEAAARQILEKCIAGQWPGLEPLVPENSGIFSSIVQRIWRFMDG